MDSGLYRTDNLVLDAHSYASRVTHLGSGIQAPSAHAFVKLATTIFILSIGEERVLRLRISSII